MYIYLFHLPLFKFAYLFFVSFLSFLSSQYTYSFVFQFVLLCFSYFCSGRYNFWFPLFVRSVYCTLFLLDCFDFVYGCICEYSVTLSIVVINLCLYIGCLQFCGVFLFSPFFLSSSIVFSFLFFINLIFNF